jgi:hypothetical protein
MRHEETNQAGFTRASKNRQRNYARPKDSAIASRHVSNENGVSDSVRSVEEIIALLSE